MKKIIVLLVSVFAMDTFSAFAANNETTTNTLYGSNFYTCQFSLNHYRGVVSGGGYTEGIVVQLNCPQEKDVSATVFVNVDGNRVASKVFTVKAGETSSWNHRGGSSSQPIKVGERYKGKEYTLDVQ